MKYTISKIVSLVFATVGAVYIGFLTFAFFRGANLSEVLGGAVFGGIFMAIGVYNFRRMSRFQTQTFAWYAKTHPSSMVNGRVRCHACASERVHVKNILQHTYTRAHLCGNCGTTLFYSPEV